MTDNDVPQGSSPQVHGSRHREPLDAEFEIVIAEGHDSEILARSQAEVLWEITKWQASRPK
ncbi:hypothetical protein [Nocardia sp.]|uniref:hypothetical protein n=1 Tax=Nocardia sp. TaxID=1821 RepID=UPI0026387C66|nr:hypothetical protein [Nocardia sp.]